METKLKVQLSQITWDTELQMRDGELDLDHVAAMAEALREDPQIELPPVEVFAVTPKDAELGAGKLWLANGWHRRQAYLDSKRTSIPAIIRSGGIELAFRFALGANADQNAKRRSRKDLRKAVRAALAKFYFGINYTKILPKKDRLSYEEIAELCRTTKLTVINVSKAMKAEHAPPEPDSSATGEAETTDQEPKTEQIDFFRQLDADFEPILSSFDDIFGQPYWIDDNYPEDDRISAVRQIRAKLKKEDERWAAKEEAFKKGTAKS